MDVMVLRLRLSANFQKTDSDEECLPRHSFAFILYFCLPIHDTEYQAIESTQYTNHGWLRPSKKLLLPVYGSETEGRSQNTKIRSDTNHVSSCKIKHSLDMPASPSTKNYLSKNRKVFEPWLALRASDQRLKNSMILILEHQSREDDENSKRKRGCSDSGYKSLASPCLSSFLQHTPSRSFTKTLCTAGDVCAGETFSKRQTHLAMCVLERPRL